MQFEGRCVYLLIRLLSHISPLEHLFCPENTVTYSADNEGKIFFVGFSQKLLRCKDPALPGCKLSARIVRACVLYASGTWRRALCDPQLSVVIIIHFSCSPFIMNTTSHEMCRKCLCILQGTIRLVVIVPYLTGDITYINTLNKLLWKSNHTVYVYIPL